MLRPTLLESEEGRSGALIGVMLSFSHREAPDLGCLWLQRLAVINLLNSMSVRSFAQVLALKKRMVLTGHVSERVMVSTCPPINGKQSPLPPLLLLSYSAITGPHLVSHSFRLCVNHTLSAFMLYKVVLALHCSLA